MNTNLRHVAGRIRSELADLQGVINRIEKGWKRAGNSGDNLYLDGVALNLHGFYSGLERIFEVIAVNVDGKRPGGENWHQELLKQMSEEIPSARPAVISNSSLEMLNDYRGFRHVVRNVYSYNFEAAKMKGLVDLVPTLFLQVKSELFAFAEFLEHA